MIIDNIIKKLYNLSKPNKKGGNYMAKSKKLGGSWIIWLILQIFFGAITGFVARLIKGHILSGILYLLTGGFFVIGWIVDIISLLVHHDYVWLWSK